MGKILFLGRIGILFAILALLSLLFFRADVIRGLVMQKIGISKQSVAGASTSMEKEMKADVKEYIHDAQRTIMQLKVADVIHSVTRLQKIGDDVNSAKDEVVRIMSNFK
jgi:hypothetical protein